MIGSQPEILFAFKYHSKGVARIKIVYCDNTDKISHCVCDDILVDSVLGVLMVRFVMVLISKVKICCLMSFIFSILIIETMITNRMYQLQWIELTIRNLTHILSRIFFLCRSNC